jgi:hypothetical protein
LSRTSPGSGSSAGPSSAASSTSTIGPHKSPGQEWWPRSGTPQAFLARRRALRPTEEYRTPTDAEWQEFLGHFERRKVATGLCGRAFGTPCIHEHSCLRCALHWPDPAQRPRIAEIRDNLTARIAEAEREGWLGEAEGVKISLAGAEDKLTQIDRRTPPTSACPPPPANPEQRQPAPATDPDMSKFRECR